MWVTIYTDASACSRSGYGSWAFWAKSEQGRLVRSGAFKEKTKGSTYAELHCILNAMTAAIKRWPNITGFYIATDSAFSISILTSPNITAKGKRKYAIELEIFKKLTKGKHIRMRHERAHVGTATTGQYLNAWCDKAAKKARSK